MASVESVPAYLRPGVLVSQPSHLEGDPSLATEILPGPPPLGSIHQAGVPRKDHKKTAISYSYLPISDPGTTYPSHIMSSIPAASTDLDGTRRKRARLDKGNDRSRSQRASARNLAAGGPSSDPIVAPEVAAPSSQLVPDDDPLALPLDSDDAMASRATTAHAEDPPSEPAPSNKRSRSRPTKDNGKGKEKERDVVKVKEEQTAVSLGNETVPSLSNEDHCSACRSFGSLVYCDGCPRAFHLWCLDPPMEPADLPEGERWFCPGCSPEQRPLSKPPASLKFMGPLLHELSCKIPSEFQLPQDIRGFFKDVASSAKGTYLDTSEVKQARLNRHGQLEDRDPYRLKDRNGDAVLCFRCGGAALPPGMTADSPIAKRARRAATSSSHHEAGRAIISCDHCHLHWHLDCMDPPLVFLPPWNKKWMCPNHADRVLQPKHRIPRTNATPIEVTKPHQWNNGIIEVVNTDAAPPPAVVPEKFNVDEVLINGRRYRVPEKIIKLDFWDKVSGYHGTHTESSDIDDASRLSSPLTSLSSLEADDRAPPMSMEPALYTWDDVRFAELLCGLRLQNGYSSSEARTGSSPDALHEGSSEVKATPKVKIKQENSAIKETDKANMDLVAVEPSSAASSSRPRRAAASRTPAPAKPRPSRRTGRSADDVPMDVDLPELVVLSGKRPDARRKAARPPQAMENVLDDPEASLNKSKVSDNTPETMEAPPTATSARSKRSRQPPRKPASPAVDGTDAHADTKHDPVQSPKSSNTASHSGKRRANGAADSTAHSSRSHHKPVTPTNVNGQSVSTTTGEHKTEATPTLKIRLPRLSALTSPAIVANAAATDTTSKASPTKGAAAASTSSRPRRSLRRQASIPASLNSAATTSDTGSAPRANETGLSTSPIESF
ncbi:hypothetical protein BD413DRAFT_24898 [Trametes elegans]|nr:hypothetical protein BD413DRAFT_24898 [Trametes elegans]